MRLLNKTENIEYDSLMKMINIKKLKLKFVKPPEGFSGW